MKKLWYVIDADKFVRGVGTGDSNKAIYDAWSKVRRFTDDDHDGAWEGMRRATGGVDKC
jgi:hypothetical protein